MVRFPKLSSGFLQVGKKKRQGCISQCAPSSLILQFSTEVLITRHLPFEKTKGLCHVQCAQKHKHFPPHLMFGFNADTGDTCQHILVCPALGL